MHGLVLLSLVLTATHICVNIWGSCVSGKSPEECKAWRGVGLLTLIYKYKLYFLGLVRECHLIY